VCGEGPGSRGKSARESRAAVKKKKRKVAKRRGLGATKAEHKSRALRILESFGGLDLNAPAKSGPCNSARALEHLVAAQTALVNAVDSGDSRLADRARVRRNSIRKQVAACMRR